MEHKNSHRLMFTYHDQSNIKHQIKKLLYIALGVVAPLALASDNNKQQIHIVTEQLPPYQIIEPDNSLSGFAVDIIKSTMARSHYAYSLKSYPWVRSYNLAQKKANHCIFSLVRLKSREKLFKWVGALSKANNVALWALKDQNIVVTTLEDAKNYTIAVIRDDVAHTGLVERGFVEGKHLYVLDDIKSLINIFITRPEIDLIIADDTTINFRAELVGVDIQHWQRVYEIEDFSLEFFFACSKKTSDRVVKHLAQNLESVYLDGTYDEIWDKWQDQLNIKK